MYKILLIEQDEYYYEEESPPELKIKEITLQELLKDKHVDVGVLGYVNINQAQDLAERLKLKPNFMIYRGLAGYPSFQLTPFDLKNPYNLYHLAEDKAILLQEVDAIASLPPELSKKLKGLKAEAGKEKKKKSEAAKLRELKKKQKRLEAAKKLLLEMEKDNVQGIEKVSGD